MENTEASSQEDIKGLDISLSKANKIRNLVKAKLQDLIGQARIASMETFNVDENDTQATVLGSREAIFSKTNAILNTFGALNEVNTRLRVTIATANDRSQVNEVITQIEQLRLGIQALRGVVPAAGRWFDHYTAERLIDHNSKALTAAADADLRPETLAMRQIPPLKTASFYAFTKEQGQQTEQSILDLEKNIRDLEEKRNELNYSTVIHLDGSIVKILTDLKII